MIWYSQAGQDEWVHSLVGDTGYFVDVGAHDGIVHSNTYALEQLGWKGLCLEANADAFVECSDNRPGSQCGYGAVSDHQGIVQFDGVRVNPAGATPVYCARLEDILERMDAPSIIDYLSVDVEGHELEVLAGMNFDRWSVRVATIEHNLYLRGFEYRDAIRERMIGFGFVLAGADVVAPDYGPYEDWWIHEAAL